jgi:DNA repair exonuclease SbcCD nuclease subunit
MSEISMICIGDQHFQNNNILEVELFIEKIEKLCIQKKPTKIILLGDLLHYHEKVFTQPLNKAYEFIDKMRKIAEVIVLVGNHDMVNHLQFMTDNHWLNGLKDWKNVKVVDTVYSETINNMKFIFMPFVPNGRFEEGLNTIEDWKDCKCIFAHQEFLGCKMGAMISVEGDKWPETYPYVISGHIHENQTPQSNIYYTGAAFQHSFGESNKNIIAYITFCLENSKYTLEEIDINMPRKRIVYKDIEDLDNYKIKKTEDQIKISVSGTIESFKSFKKSKKYKEILDNGVKVVFKPKKIEKINTEDLNESVVSDDIHFKNILLELLNKDKNKFLIDIYNEILK